MVDYHTCIRTANQNDHRHLSSAIVAQHLVDHIRNGPLYPVKEIRTQMKNIFGVDISYKKAWYARRAAIDNVYGDWPSSISQLPQYMKELQTRNPGTTVAWRHYRESGSIKFVFDYVFWAFAPAIQAFQYMRPVICVDGTHMHGPYKSKMLMATGINADNRYLLLAFALVNKESNDS